MTTKTLESAPATNYSEKNKAYARERLDLLDEIERLEKKLTSPEWAERHELVTKAATVAAALKELQDSSTPKSSAAKQRARRWKKQIAEIEEEIATIEKKGAKRKGTAADRGALARNKRRCDRVTEEWVLFNKPLVLQYCKKFTSHSSPHDTEDYFAAGMLGLMRAIGTYNPDLGVFGQWAMRTIKREVHRCVNQAEFPSISTAGFDKRLRIIAARNKLIAENPTQEPTNEQVAEAVGDGMKAELVNQVLNAIKIDSLSTAITAEDGSEISLMDLLPEDGDPADKIILANEIAALERYGLDCLEPAETFILVRRFGLDGEKPQTLSAIGDQLGVGRESARQKFNKILAKLGHPSVLGKLKNTQDLK